MIFDGSVCDPTGTVKETLTVELRQPVTRRDVPSRRVAIFLIYVKEMQNEIIAERLHSVCATVEDAEQITAAICDAAIEWQYTEPKAEAVSMPLTTFAEWSHENLLRSAKAKLTEAEIKALLAEMRKEL